MKEIKIFFYKIVWKSSVYDLEIILINLNVIQMLTEHKLFLI